MKLCSRGLRILTATTLAISLLLTTPMVMAAGMPYTDIEDGSWYESAVEYC